MEYKGRTLWDCAGSNPSDPAHNPGCTVVPPGGLQAKLHLPVLTWLPCLTLRRVAALTLSAIIPFSFLVAQAVGILQ